jgi:hypothetical protein
MSALGICSRLYPITRMTGLGRLLLYAMTGVVGPVYASNRLFTRLDFQSDKGLESAKTGPSCDHQLLINRLIGRKH